PLAAKIRGLRTAGRPVVVVNGAEGEPASAKDRVLLGRTPHLVLDGAALLAAAIGAHRVLVAITDQGQAPGLQRAIGSRPDATLFELHGVAAGFVTGEATALVSALNGGPATPSGRRTLPADRGVAGAPTILSNAETFGQLAVLARTGPAEFASVGTPAEPGTTLLSVSGAVARPGVVEVPLGAELGVLAAAVGAQPSQALVIGGYHGTWVPPAELSVSRAGLAPLGASLGAGVLIFVGERTCPLGELSRVAQWLADQSVKQCGPCAFGLPALAADIRALLSGAGRGWRRAGPGWQGNGPAAALRHAGQLAGRGACAHPDGAVRFLSSGLSVLADEIRTHAAYGGCRRHDLGMLALSRPAAFARSL
ncbi:MAG: hypothetical protein QOI26_1720, partial [Pseudonocardiales bacterium]|nr:hypothetical protein [Pseudonocardiales bacterium]